MVENKFERNLLRIMCTTASVAGVLSLGLSAYVLAGGQHYQKLANDSSLNAFLAATGVAGLCIGWATFKRLK